ncbi:MAG: SPOR domain-containing protein [Pseudomonadota bacterium]
MGLFSFLRKNKQQAGAAEGGYTARADDKEVSALARAKRASHAGASAGARRGGKEAADPVLPEKKRARRRLVGAVALALGVAVGLPMVLDSEPKPLNADIAIDIPPKDKPADAAPALPAAPANPASAANTGASRVAASAALDQSEQIVSAVPDAPAKAPAAGPVPLPAEPRAQREHADLKPPVPPKHESKPAAPKSGAPGLGAPVLAAKPAPKAEEHAERVDHAEHAEPKPAKAGEDAARAMAILEGRPNAKAQDEGGAKFVVQVAALATQDKVDELQGKLRDAGIKSYTQRVPTPAGERTRIRVGPFASREEAEKVRAKLAKIGLSGSLVPA